MTPSRRSIAVRRMFRWGAYAALLHSVLLILIAPSVFLYYGEGPFVSRRRAMVLHHLLDGVVEGLVYEIANYHIPQRVYGWLLQQVGSIDEVVLISQTVLYLVVGGAFYFAVGAAFSAALSGFGVLRRAATAVR